MRLNKKVFSRAMYVLFILFMSCLLSYQVGKDAARRDARIEAESVDVRCLD